LGIGGPGGGNEELVVSVVAVEKLEFVERLLLWLLSNCDEFGETPLLMSRTLFINGVQGEAAIADPASLIDFCTGFIAALTSTETRPWRLGSRAHATYSSQDCDKS